MRKEILPRWRSVPSRNSSAEHEDSVLYAYLNAETAQVPRRNHRSFHTIHTEFTFVDQLHNNCTSVNDTSRNKQHEIAKSIRRLSSESVDLEIVNITRKLIRLLNEVSVIHSPLKLSVTCKQ